MKFYWNILMSKKLLQYVVCTLLLVFSQQSYAYADNNADARAFVKSTSDRVISVITSSGSSSSKEDKLDDIFIEVMDIDWIAKFVLGKYWNTLDDAKKTQYMKQYREYLIASYVPLFKDYNGQKMDIKDIKTIKQSQYLVVTDIEPSDPQSASYRVEYRVHFDNGNFRVRDIIAEGISMITTQRSDFASILNTSGFDSLIQKLKDKSK
jgi:phospholipid transport system substrate-binding protein